MTDPHTHFHWLPCPDAEPPPSPWQPLSDAVYAERAVRAPDHSRLLALAPDWARDLNRVARAVFAADRYALRREGLDRWTRHIRLSVPVTAPNRWASALPHLTAMLGTMTGDMWDIAFRPTDFVPTPATPLPFGTEAFATEVALFSGGLDSLGWAAQRACADTSRSLLLVTLEERNFEADQSAVFQSVVSLSKRRRSKPRQLLRLDQSQHVRGPGGTRKERSTRTRGFLYAATAVQAATAERVPIVHLPENGQLALNPPLSAGRLGACSTRSVHPWTLHHFNRLIEEVADPGDAVRIENPFASLTKGEVCAVAKDAGLPQSALEATLSCGQPPKRRPNQPDLGHCGLCFPCLVRRSGLLHAFGEDRTPYAADPWDRKLSAERTKHWRALVRWLTTSLTPLDLVADAPLPPGVHPAELLPVIERGREELRALVAWSKRQGHTAA
jgi:hypothetical protein